jgi:subtilisin family serine protease
MRKAKMLCLLLVLAFMPAIWAGQISPDLEDYLQGLATSDDVGVLVMFNEQADINSLDLQLKREHATLAERNRVVIQALQDVASRTQPALVAYLDQLKGQDLIGEYRTLWIANMAVIKATKAGVYAMADNQAIADIYYDYVIEPINPVKIEDSDAPLIATHEIGLERINAPAAWAAGFTGQGRVVANMDTGVDGTHPALAARFRGDVDDDGDVDESWYDPYAGWTNPQDSGSHGTHTMGTICGRSPAGDTVGVAIDAQWIAAAPIDRGGGINRTVQDALLSFQWFVDPDDNPNTQDNPDAVGNSWGISPIYHGVPPCDPTFWAVIDNLEAAGTAVIFSAGNEGPGASTLRTPADRATTDYNVFSVGSVNGASPSLPISDFSSRGPSYCTQDGQPTFKPEVVAPGENVRSSVPGGGYSTMSGTSMASPHITGAVGVIRGVNPDLDVDAIKEILMATAVDLGPEGEDNSYGHGVIDLYEACLVAMQGYGYAEGYIYNEDSQVIEGARVSVDGSTRWTTADDTGFYHIGLPADTSYTLTASFFGYVSESADVAITPDSTTTQDFTLAYADYGVLHGYVTDLDLNPIEGASISVANTPLDPVNTNSDGYYIMDNIPGGADYTIEVSAVGYRFGSGDIFVPVGDTAQLDFALQEMESFEGSNGGYTGEGVWEWGQPTSGPNGAYDGNNVWGTVLAGQYPNNADDALYTPFYEIDGANAVLSFYHWYNMENNYDGGNLHVSTDGGNTWMLITPDGGYPNPDVVGLDQEPGFSDQTGGWQQVVVDLSAYQGQTIMIKFRFGTDGSVVRDGWYIDGVVLNGGTIVAPEGHMDHGSMFMSLPADSSATEVMTMSNTGQATLIYDVTVLTDLNNVNNSDQGQPVVDDGYPNTKEGYTVTEDGEIKLESDPPGNGGVITRVGGPDAFGYTFMDSEEDGGPTYEWIDITGIGTPVAFNGSIDDGYSDMIPMGMSFEFYGIPYDQLMISTNGWISFNSYTSSYLSNYSIPTGSNPNAIVAVEWDDLDGGAPGVCYYYYDEPENRFIVSWVDWAYYPDATTPVHNIQVILDGDDNSIVTQYGDIAGDYQDDVTIGIENEVGEVGLQYSYNDFAAYTGLAIRYTYPLFWLTVDPMSGSIEPGESQDMMVTFDATDLEDGDYFGEIRITTNDPNHSMFAIPCTLHVGPVSVDDGNEAVPSVFTLDQNYPNPFNPTTEIKFGVPATDLVRLEVYDIMGRRVATLANEEMTAGTHSVIWNGTNDSGDQVTSGVYFYRLSQGDNTLTKKMIMLK